MMYDLKWRKWWKKRAIGKYDQVTEREERKRTQKIQKKKKRMAKNPSSYLRVFPVSRCSRVSVTPDTWLHR